MPTAHLTDRALIDLSGPDAVHFLQTILTTDIDALPAEEARPGALLSPQGKILFDFLVSRTDTGCRLDCRADVVADFARRLTLYRLRAKVEISVADHAVVAVLWETDSNRSQTDSSTSSSDSTVRDTRFKAATVHRVYVDVPPADASPADWQSFRVGQGVAESGDDYALGDAFPHDVLLDQTGGVGFRKGCYVGQEVVSRMQHRGTARRRVLLVSGDADLPPPGTDVTAGGRVLGTLGSVAGRRGLAMLRIDRAKEAMDAATPILAGPLALTVAVPPWASFGFPADTAET